MAYHAYLTDELFPKVQRELAEFVTSETRSFVQSGSVQVVPVAQSGFAANSRALLLDVGQVVRTCAAIGNRRSSAVHDSTRGPIANRPAGKQPAPHGAQIFAARDETKV